jgi:pilus assembly protein Flp/PilA
MNLFSRFAKCQSGATAIEYGLIASLISVAVVGTLSTTGSNLGKTFDKVKGNLT